MLNMDEFWGLKRVLKFSLRFSYSKNDKLPTNFFWWYSICRKMKYKQTHIPKSGGGRQNVTSWDDVIFGLIFVTSISPRKSKNLKKYFPIRIFYQESTYIESTYWIIYSVNIKDLIQNYTHLDHVQHGWILRTETRYQIFP